MISLTNYICEKFLIDDEYKDITHKPEISDNLRNEISKQLSDKFKEKNVELKQLFVDKGIYPMSVIALYDKGLCFTDVDKDEIEDFVSLKQNHTVLIIRIKLAELPLTTFEFCILPNEFSYIDYININGKTPTKDREKILSVVKKYDYDIISIYNHPFNNRPIFFSDTTLIDLYGFDYDIIVDIVLKCADKFGL